MKSAIVMLTCLALCAACLSPAAAERMINNCPLPDDMKIVPPDPDEVPAKLAKLSGIWEGNWGPMPVLFIVERIRKNEAVVLHAVAGRQMARGMSTPPGHFRKVCPVEMGEDGHYRIVMELSQGTNRLIQTDDPRYLRVVREGFSGLTEASRDTMFRKRETP
ncbi:MAG: hypothetical protein HPY67_04465 [Syntrophaceae bacterium]|nr:hypothetical protein [Syntrophaceae bacterium]